MPYQVRHDPDGYACNMGYVVVDTDTGDTVHRGPEWACEVNAGERNRDPLGRSDTERRADARLLACAANLATLLEGVTP